METELKKQFKKIPLSENLAKCEVCSKMALVVYWNYTTQKWECKECHWKREKDKRSD